MPTELGAMGQSHATPHFEGPLDSYIRFSQRWYRYTEFRFKARSSYVLRSRCHRKRYFNYAISLSRFEPVTTSFERYRRSAAPHYATDDFVIGRYLRLDGYFIRRLRCLRRR